MVTSLSRRRLLRTLPPMAEAAIEQVNLKKV